MAKKDDGRTVQVELPPVHNVRAPAQWEIISSHVNFADKAVLDLGCGYADILLRCWQAGAVVCGIDKDGETLWQRAEFLRGHNVPGDEFFLINTNLDLVGSGQIDALDGLYPISADIIICFSVLPYVKEPALLLDWIADHSKLALIECQYQGDGPGFKSIENDEDMRALLELFWQQVEPIGQTLVEDRQKYRTIWKCS